MLLHLIPKSSFTSGEILFLDEVFGNKEVEHWLYGRPWQGYEGFRQSRNIHIVSSVTALRNDPVFKKQLEKCTYILVDYASVSLLCMLAPYSKKIIVQFWGGDLNSIVSPKGLFGAIRSRMALSVLKRCAGLITLTEREYSKLSALADMNGFHFVGGVGATKEVMQKTYLEIEHLPHGKNVLVGNSATPSGNHKEVFDILAKYLPDGIEVYAPLSYGNEAYAKEVSEYGFKVMGSSFHPLTTYLDKDRYAHFLATVDVAVFNFERQQGLGNIYQLLLSGAKVYLPRESDLFDHLSRIGFEVFPITEIESLDYLAFMRYDEQTRVNNSRLAMPEEIWKRWVSNWTTIREHISSYGQS